MKTKKCRCCGKEFTAAYGNEQFCSDECKHESIRESRRRSDNKRLGYTELNTQRRTCAVCGATFTPNAATQKTCTEECGKEYKRTKDRERERKKPRLTEQERNAARLNNLRKANEWRTNHKKPKPTPHIYTGTCAVCGNVFTTHNPSQKTCSKQCGKRYSYARKQHRIPKEQRIDNDITLEALYRRDSGVCYLCGGKCDWNDRDKEKNTCGANYPTIDHIIPVARGGLHAWNNVRLAHFICNALKSDEVMEGTEDLIPANAYEFKRYVREPRKEVTQYTKDGEWLATYISTAEAERQTGVKQRGIQNCACNRCKSYGGYVWKYSPV